jgi:hypothetical protein
MFSRVLKSGYNWYNLKAVNFLAFAFPGDGDLALGLTDRLSDFPPRLGDFVSFLPPSFLISAEAFDFGDFIFLCCNSDTCLSCSFFHTFKDSPLA